jgi:hypothetical protein
MAAVYFRLLTGATASGTWSIVGLDRPDVF